MTTKTIQELLNTNKNYTIALASHIYLNPVNVFLCSTHILGSYWNDYSNNNNNGLKWFDDIITNILISPVQFEVSGYFGMATNYSKKEKAVLCFKLFGNILCQISLELFLKESIPKIHEIFQYLINPLNKCFLFINCNDSLKGEFFLSCFQYNQILNDLFEPSFYIIILITRYIELVITSFKGEESNIIRESIKISVILEKFLFSNETTGYNLKGIYLESQIKRIYNDLNKLYNILKDSITAQNLYKNLIILWKEKAEECLLQYDSIEILFKHLYKEEQ